MSEIPLVTALGRRIRELRRARGYSQEDFADAVGVHRTYMGSIERGETNLSILSLQKIAITLNLTLSDVLEGLGPTPKEDERG